MNSKEICITSFLSSQEDIVLSNVIINATLFTKRACFPMPVFITPKIAEELRWTKEDSEKIGWQVEMARITDLSDTMFFYLKNKPKKFQNLIHKRKPRFSFGESEDLHIKAMITPINRHKKAVIIAKPDESII